MKVLKFSLLYLITSVVPSVILYIIFDGLILKLVLGSFLVLWAAIFMYLDKILLVSLNAREVIDTDEQLLFQNIKNEAYKSYERPPKVYLYTGQTGGCFVLESRSEWTLVIERSLLHRLKQEECESLVKFLFEYKQSGKAWLQTKVMGIAMLSFNILHWFFRNVLMLKTSSKIFKVLAVFFIGMIRPFLTPLELLAKRQTGIYVDQSLKPIYLQTHNNSSFSIIEYILGHLLSDSDLKRLSVKYLESFPVIENCRFHETEA